MFRPSLSRLAAGLWLGFVVPVAGAADDDLVRRVRDGHRAARESIRTFSAVIILEDTHTKQGVWAQGRYWRSGNTARIQEGQEGKHTGDYLLKGGEIRTAGRTWKPGKSSPTGIALRQPGDKTLGFCDVWAEMLIEMYGPAGYHLDLDRVLEAADGPVRADREKLDGRECVRLRYQVIYGGTGKTSVTQWHDVGRNYLVCKLVVEYPDDPSSFRDVIQVTDFIEPSPGVVFPIKVRRDFYKKGELFQARVATLSEVAINKPLPKSALALPALPPGTVLHDYIDNIEGPIDSNWKPIGKMKSLAPRPVPPAEHAPPADRPMPVETTQSTSEPVSSTWWVIGGSAVVLLAGAGLALVRRIRTGRQLAA